TGVNAGLAGTSVTVQAKTPDAGSSDFKTWGLAAAGGKDYGVAGSVAINRVSYHTDALLGTGTTVSATGGAVNVLAIQNIGLQALAGGGGFGQKAGVGVGVSLQIVDTGTHATVGNNSVINAAGATTVRAAETITPIAIALPSIPLLPGSISVMSIAAGAGLSTGNTGVAGSFVVNVFTLETAARIGANVQINQAVANAQAGQDVVVQATDTTEIVSIAGGLAAALGSSGTALAGGVDVGVLNKTTRASVGTGSQIKARRDIKVDADGGEEVTSVAATVSASTNASVGISASVYVVNTTTRAQLDNGTAGSPAADLEADGGIYVTSDSPFVLTPVAGQVAVGSEAGVGISNTTLVHNDTVEALVGHYADLTTHGAAGVTVRATSSENLVAVAAGGSVGGTAGVAGSATVNILNETTNARIGNGVSITGQPLVAGQTTPDVLVKASDTTDIIAVGGSVAAGGTAGVGAGASVAKLAKNTDASIGSGVTADVAGDLQVLADTAENVISIAAAASGGGSAGIAGAAGVLVMDIVTRAFIGDDPDDQLASVGAGNVHARGSIQVSANDILDETNIVGSLGVAGAVGVGASVGVPVVNKRVEAFVGKGAKVTADGQSALDVNSGGFAVNYVTGLPEKPSNLDIKNGHRPTAADAKFGPPDIGGAVDSDHNGSSDNKLDTNHDGIDDRTGEQMYSGLREAGLAKANGFTGLSVTATNRDSVKNFALAGGGAATAAVSVAAGVNVFDTSARAYIGDGAQVNSDTSSGAGGQSVLVGSGNDFYHLEVAGALAVAAGAGIAPAVGVSVLTLHTDAYIGANATVRARNDVLVDAHASQNLLAIAAGLGGGVAGIGGAVNVPVISSTTSAYINSGATVAAGGDVAVTADDKTKTIVVSGAIGAGVAGIGASVGVLSVTKATSAYIGSGAHVDAKANGTGVSGVLNGTANGTDSFNTGTARGVIVQATSAEDVVHLAIAAGAGVAGIAGGVAISLINSATSARIDSNAEVNQDGNDNASGAQGVTVRAGNRVNTLSFAGGLAGGFVGIAGAVDVGIIKNDTSAVVRTGAKVSARGNVAIGAHHLDHNQGFTLALGAGVVGVGASVSVWSLGTALGSGYKDGDNNPGDALYGKTSPKDGGSGSQQGRLDQMTADQGGGQNAQVSQLLGGYKQAPANDGKTDANERMGAISNSAAASLNSRGPSGQSLKTLINNGTIPKGTQAVIEAGATVTSGADMTVDALDRTVADFIVGGGGGGLVGVGASVAVLNVNNNARASASGYLWAGGQIRVNGALEEQIDQHSFAFGAGFVGLGASVSVMNVGSTNYAVLADGVVVNNASSISLAANTKQAFSALTISAQGGAVAVGASFSRIAVGNGGPNVEDTHAGIGANAHIGLGSGSVGGISILAKSTITIDQDTYAAAGGAGATTVNFAFAEVKPKVLAEIGNGSQINSTGNISVLAGTDHSAKVNVFSLSVGGLAVGLSLADANIDPDVYATVGGDITAAGNVTVSAAHNVDPATGLPIETGFANRAALARLQKGRDDTDVEEVAEGSAHGAYALAEAPAVGVVTAKFSIADANSSADVKALITAGAVFNAGGTVNVNANAVDQARARGKGFAVSGAGFGLLNADATATGQQRALVDPNVEIKAGGLSLDAQGVSHADAVADTTDVSFIGSLGFSKATADASSTTTAQIGAGSDVDVEGNVSVHASSVTDADSRARRAGFSLGGDFGMITAKSTATPTLSALIASSAGNQTKINAGGSVTVQAEHGSPVSLSDGTLSGINTANNTLTTTQPHGLTTGDRVTYSTNGNAAIGGLVADKTYGVIVIDNTTVKLGNPFTDDEVDDAFDTVHFANPHGLKTGDTIVYGYTGAGASAIGGLANNQIYYVRVIDAETVKLGTSLAQVTAPLKGFGTAAVNATTETITLAGHNFADGAAVTFRGPRTAKFNGFSVDENADKLFIGPAANGNDFQTGDRVTYTVTGVNGKPATAIGGLGNNGSYYVLRVDANSVKLSTTPLVFDPDTNTWNGSFVNLSRSDGADISQHSLTRYGEKAVGGLTDGKTYYVKRLDADHFQLSETKNGAAVNLDLTGVAGTQYVGVEGIDLSGAGTAGTHYLAQDLSGALNGTQRLAGAGGLVAPENSLGVNGVSEATGIGPSFALLINGVGAHSDITLSPSVTASAGDGAYITAGGNVKIASAAFGNADGKSGAFAGSLLGSFGFSDVNITLNQSSQSTVGSGAFIDAQGRIDVTSENRHVAGGKSQAGAASGAVSGGGADASVTASPVTTTNIGSGARLHAEGDIAITAAMGAKGTIRASSEAYAGLGSGGSTDASWNIGPLTPQYITVNLDANSNVRSEHNLLLRALVNDTDIEARGTASAASAFYSDPDSDATARISTVARVTAQTGAAATGVDVFDAIAQHSGVRTYAHSYADGGSLFGGPDSDAYTIQGTRSTVITADSSSFASKDLRVKALVQNMNASAYAGASGFTLNPFDQPDGTVHQTRDWVRAITYDGDVILLSAPTPELLVNAAGQIVTAKGLTAQDQGTRIWVDDISNDGNAGKALFEVNPISFGNVPLSGTIDGNQGKLIVRHTWETVKLTNLSSKDLWVNAINPVDKTGVANVTINVDLNAYRFDITHDYAPTKIDIGNTGAVGAPDIYIHGLIDNPIGTTNIVNLRGDIFGTNTGKVRTNRGYFEAAGNIGQLPQIVLGSLSLGRLDTELVQSEGRKTQLDTKSGGYQALRIRGLDRDPSLDPFTLNLNTLQAGSDIDLLFLATQVQTQPANYPTSFNVVVTVDEPSFNSAFGLPASPVSGNFKWHYTPDPANGPAFVPPVGIFGTGSATENTLVKIDLLKAGGNINVVASWGTTRMDITANTDLTGQGRIDVYTNGDIALTEVLGDLRAGSITSTQNDVTLVAAAGIVDAQGDDTADVTGNAITMTALNGGIGSFLNDLEIDSAYSAAGTLWARATTDVFVHELTAALTVDDVTAQSGDVRLTTTDTRTSGENIVVAAGKIVSAMGGSITLQAGDDIVIGGSVLALSNLFFAVDHRNADRATGGNVALRSATLKGSKLFLYGDEDGDTLDATGIDIAVVAYGWGGNDFITGGIRDDEIYGGEGADRIVGDKGNDLIVAGGGIGDILLGGEGNDIIYGSADGSDADANFDDDTRVGDHIEGGAGKDSIYAQGGADDIYGGDGDDYVDAGAGNDRVQAGSGADVVYGHLGNDLIYGFSISGDGDDAARDVLYGEWGDDSIAGGGGHDLIDGGYGNDYVIGGAGDDIIYTGYGLNNVAAGDGDDQVFGSDDGADNISGGAGADRIYGYAGNDVIDGGAGADSIEGGAGDDQITGGAGSDVLVGGADNDIIYGHSAAGGGDDNAVDWLYGDNGSGGNEAGQGRDRLYGQGGNDLIFGEGGDDLIEGSQGFNQAETSGGASNVIDFGDSGDTSSFVAPVATAAPALKAVDYGALRAGASLPDGIVQRGRWGDLAGAGNEDGLSGSGGLSTDPAIAVGADGSQYVAWTDTRSGNPQILVAKLVGGIWVQLGGSASGNALGAGVSKSIGAASRPSIAIDSTGAPIVSWTADHNGVGDVYVARYNTTTSQWVALGGSASGGGVSLTGTAGETQIVSTAGGPMVVWLDGPAGQQSVYAKVFNGTTWVEMGAGSASGQGLAGGTAGADVRDLDVTTDGTRVAAAWSQNDDNGIRQIYLKEYAGSAWAAVAASASGTGVSGIVDASVAGSISHNAQPSVAYFNGQLYVAWQAFSDEGAAVAVASYSNTAARTLSAVDVFGAPSVPSSPDLSTGGGTLRLLWVRQPLENRLVDLYALRFDGSHFVEELPGEAQPGGISESGGKATQLATATDSQGRTTVVWQDSFSGQPEIYARGMSATVSRTFVADATTSIQSILDANDLGAGDVIVVKGTVAGNVTISANDAGVLIYGAPGAQVDGGITVLAGADNVIVQRISSRDPVVVQGAANFTLTESSVGGLVLNAGSNAQITYNHIAGNVSLNGAVTGALIDHNRIVGARGVDVQPVAGIGAGNLTLSWNSVSASQVGIALEGTSSGRIRDNNVTVGETGTGLNIAATFAGLIDNNKISGGATGVVYGAGAALSGNTISDALVGVRTTVAGTAAGLGFVTGSGVNHVTGNDIGVIAVNAQFQQLHIADNEVGITGAGIAGGESLTFANLVEGNRRGLENFQGTVQYSRFTGNGVAINVTAASNGLKIFHNLVYVNGTGVLVAGATDVRIYQNTFYSKGGDNIRLQNASSNVEIQGNILWAESGYDIYVANDSQSGFYSDYNNLYKTGNGKLVYWTKDFADVLDWQADVARYDLHSIGATKVNPEWAKPRFADIHGGDFRVLGTVAGLRFTSPNVEASNVLLDQSVPPYYNNLITNAGFENGTTGWTVNLGGAVKTSAPAAYLGSQYFNAGNIEQGFAQQSINLLTAGFSITQIDSGLLDLAFGGRVRAAAEVPRDAGSVSLIFLDAQGNEIRRQTVQAQNTADRWELVGDRVTAPVGARFAVLRFDADRNSGGSADVWFDNGFVYSVSDGYVPDLGAYGAGTHEASTGAARKIMLRFPDLYTDWEKNEPLAVRWQTVNNTSFSSVRIDLVQDTANGPRFVTNIVAATPDDGEFIWIPGNSGIDFGTKGLRIQVSLVDAPEVIDRSQETFSVPEDGTNYYVDDGSNAGDVYTPNAIGDNRNTGKTPDAPKPNPVNVLRAYDLKAGDTLYIDTGDYPMIDPIAVSGSNDVSLVAGPGMGLDEGFTITGPVDPALVARLFPAIPGDKTRALIDLDDADFVSINHLTLENAQRGVYVHNGSDSFSASWITASGHAQQGFLIDTASPFGDFDHLTAYNNGAAGVVISGSIESLTNSVAFGNAGIGFSVTGAIARATDNEAHGNTDWGFAFSQSGAVLIQRNRSYDNRAGIYLSNNTGSANATVGDTDLTKNNGNLVYNNRDGGIYAYYGAVVAGNTVYGHNSANAWGIYGYSNVAVRSNVVFSNTQGVYTWYGSVENNRVYNHTAEGVRAENSDVLGNVIYSNAVGLRTYAYGNTPRTARGNLIYGNTQAGAVVTGDGLTFINNTVVQAAGDAIKVADASNVSLYNNILGADAGYALSVASNSQIGFKSDYNLFMPSAAGVLGQWQGVDRSSLASWRGASFTDANSLVADPRFVDSDGADNKLGYVNLAQDGRDDDFHERSAYGGFSGGSGQAPVRNAVNGLPMMIAASALTSTVQSPVIDRGRASDPYSNEPTPNGGYVNIGAYGNTAQAGRSPAQYVTVLSPNGGERIGQDSAVEIRWRSFGFSGNVSIEYRGGNAANFTMLSANEANDGSYNWLVDAASFVPGTNYEIRITSITAPAVGDVTDATFSVIAPITYYYVNDNSLAGDEYTTAAGSDANDGLSPDQPKASIRAVLDTYDLKAGDVILVDTGNYLLGTNIYIVGQDSGVTIRGAVNHSTVLNRGNTNTGTAVFELQGADDVTLDHLSITGALTGVL
ncbi:MAG: hypothetical protein EPO12_11675, partial [Aquabacterium sp.]